MIISERSFRIMKPWQGLRQPGTSTESTHFRPSSLHVDIWTLKSFPLIEIDCNKQRNFPRSFSRWREDSHSGERSVGGVSSPHSQFVTPQSDNSEHWPPAGGRSHWGISWQKIILFRKRFQISLSGPVSARLSVCRGDPWLWYSWQKRRRTGFLRTASKELEGNWL